MHKNPLPSLPASLCNLVSVYSLCVSATLGLPSSLVNTFACASRSWHAPASSFAHKLQIIDFTLFGIGRQVPRHSEPSAEGPGGAPAPRGPPAAGPGDARAARGGDGASTMRATAAAVGSGAVGGAGGGMALWRGRGGRITCHYKYIVQI